MTEQSKTNNLPAKYSKLQEELVLMSDEFKDSVKDLIPANPEAPAKSEPEAVAVEAAPVATFDDGLNELESLLAEQENTNLKQGNEEVLQAQTVANSVEAIENEALNITQEKTTEPESFIPVETLDDDVVKVTEPETVRPESVSEILENTNPNESLENQNINNIEGIGKASELEPELKQSVENASEKDPVEEEFLQKITEARKSYSDIEYKHTSMTKKISNYFKKAFDKEVEEHVEVKAERERYERIKDEYKKYAVEKLKAKENKENEREEIAKLLKFFGYDEAINLYEARATTKIENLTGIKKILSIPERIAQYYRQIPIKYKLALTGLALLSGVGGVTIAGAGVILGARQILGGISAGVGTAQFSEVLAKMSLNYVNNRNIKSQLTSFEEVKKTEDYDEYTHLLNMLDDVSENVEVTAAKLKVNSYVGKAAGVVIGTVLGTLGLSRLAHGAQEITENFGAHLDSPNVDPNQVAYKPGQIESHMLNPNAGTETNPFLNHEMPQLPDTPLSIDSGDGINATIREYVKAHLDEARASNPNWKDLPAGKIAENIYKDYIDKLSAAHPNGFGNLKMVDGKFVPFDKVYPGQKIIMNGFKMVDFEDNGIKVGYLDHHSHHVPEVDSDDIEDADGIEDDASQVEQTNDVPSQEQEISNDVIGDLTKETDASVAQTSEDYQNVSEAARLKAEELSKITRYSEHGNPIPEEYETASRELRDLNVAKEALKDKFIELVGVSARDDVAYGKALNHMFQGVINKNEAWKTIKDVPMKNVLEDNSSVAKSVRQLVAKYADPQILGKEAMPLNEKETAMNWLKRVVRKTLEIKKDQAL